MPHSGLLSKSKQPCWWSRLSVRPRVFIIKWLMASESQLDRCTNLIWDNPSNFPHLVRGRIRGSGQAWKTSEEEFWAEEGSWGGGRWGEEGFLHVKWSDLLSKHLKKLLTPPILEKRLPLWCLCVVQSTSDSMAYCPLLAMPMLSRSYTEVASCRLAWRASAWSGRRLITPSALVWRDREEKWRSLWLSEKSEWFLPCQTWNRRPKASHHGLCD